MKHDLYGVLTVGCENGTTRRRSLSGEGEARLEASGSDYTVRLTLKQTGDVGHVLVQWCPMVWEEAQRALLGEWETIAEEVLER